MSTHPHPSPAENRTWKGGKDISRCQNPTKPLGTHASTPDWLGARLKFPDNLIGMFVSAEATASEGQAALAWRVDASCCPAAVWSGTQKYQLALHSARESVTCKRRHCFWTFACTSLCSADHAAEAGCLQLGPVLPYEKTLTAMHACKVFCC